MGHLTGVATTYIYSMHLIMSLTHIIIYTHAHTHARTHAHMHTFREMQGRCYGNLGMCHEMLQEIPQAIFCHSKVGFRP